MLEIHNMEKEMKHQRRILIITFVLIIVLFLGYFVALKNSIPFTKIEGCIFIITLFLGGVYLWKAIKKDKEEIEGQPPEDELSNLIKYKTGHYAYMTSMYMWLFFFIFKDKFPNIESLIGGGVLLSSLIYFISILIVKREYNGK